MRAAGWVVLAVCALGLSSMTWAGESKTLTPKEKEAKIRELLRVNGSEETARQTMAQMSEMFLKNKQLPPGFAERFLEIASADQIVEMTIPIYMKHIADEDLDALIEFYSSPAGRRLIAAQPLIIQESLKVGQAWGERMARQALKDIQAK